MTDSELLEQSFEIAWDVLDRSGDIGDRDAAARYLSDEIGKMIKRGEKRRLLLTNVAIDAYRRRHRTLALVAC
jgi:predicted RNA-binding protein with EMAP domain